MKKGTLTTLVIGALAAYTVPPCSAQALETAPEAVTASAENPQEEAFAQLHNELGGIVQALSEIQTEDDAAFFPLVGRVWLYNAMTETLAFLVDTAKDTTPEAMERRQWIRTAVHAIATTDPHGSSILELQLWGWKQLDVLLEQGDEEAFTLFFQCYYSYYIYIEGASALAQELARVKNKESADKRSLTVEGCICMMRGVDGMGCKAYTPAPEAFRAWMQDGMGRLEDADARVREWISEMRDVHFYGSAKLESALLLYEKPAVPLEVQIERVRDYATTMCAYEQEIRDILFNVTDKESADAAAVRIMEIRQEMDAKTAEHVAWLDFIYPHNNLIFSTPDCMSMLFESSTALDEAIERLSMLEPPYYGSQALADVFAEDDAPDDEVFDDEDDYGFDEDNDTELDDDQIDALFGEDDVITE